MHNCSNDLENSSRIYLYSFIFSVFVFFGILLRLYDALESFQIIIPVWIETPSIIGLYYFFINLFEKYLWKFKWIKFLGLPIIPNLNGKWDAIIKSSYGKGIQKDAEVSISHNYSKFSMILKTDESTSETTIAHFELGNPIFRILSYSYLSKPRPTSQESMNMHEGTANLEILEDNKKLKGFYYTGRGRETFGEIELIKK